MKNALLLSMLWLGCGRPEEGATPPTGESPVLSQPAGEVGTIEALPTATELRPALAQPPPDRLGATITGLSDGRLRALVGMMSCGFWEIGRGTVDITSRQASLDLPLDVGGAGQGFQLFFFVDQFGDGKCTDEDVFSVDLPALPASGLQIDASKLTPSYVGCWVFGDL